jgi:hypothetical protein
LSRNSGASTSWNHKDLSRLVAGKFYLFEEGIGGEGQKEGREEMERNHEEENDKNRIINTSNRRRLHSFALLGYVGW